MANFVVARSRLRELETFHVAHVLLWKPFSLPTAKGLQLSLTTPDPDFEKQVHATKGLSHQDDQKLKDTARRGGRDM